MKKNKILLVISLAAAISCSAVTIAQAGTTRSGGGHGMVNARNYVATRNLGGRMGNHFSGFNRANSDLQKAISNFRAQHSSRFELQDKIDHHYIHTQQNSRLHESSAKILS